METSFPIYILRLGKTTEILFPDGKVDLGHTEFWEQTISFIAAGHFKVPQRKLANLPYCQRRARIVGDKVYYGEKPTGALIAKIRKVLENEALEFVFDEHERRLKSEVRQFRHHVGKRRT